LGRRTPDDPWYRIVPGPALVPARYWSPPPKRVAPQARCPAPRHELTASGPPPPSPNSGMPPAAPPRLDWLGGRARQHCVRPGYPAHRRQSAGLRAGAGGGLGHLSREGALPACWRDRGHLRRRVDRQYQPDARALRRGRRLPYPPAAGRRRQRPRRRLARPGGNRHGRLARHARRRAADRGDRPRPAPAARRGGRRRPRSGQRRHAAAALSRPDDQAVPRRADVVPAVAARPERDVAAAAHPGDRQGRARGDRRAPRARPVRRGPRVPRPAVRAGRRAPQGAAPQDHRPRARRPRRPPVGRGRGPGADRARRGRPLRPGPAVRSRVVLQAGGPVVEPGVTRRGAGQAAGRCRLETTRGRCARQARSRPPCTCPRG
jgi:hypothetical protein